MRGVLKVFRKDLFEFLSDPKSLLLLVVLPLTFVALIGRLRGQPVSLRLLLAGWPESVQTPLDLLRDVTSFQITRFPRALADPLQEIRRGSYDLVVNVEDFDSGKWEFYTGETDPVRLRMIGVFAQHLQSVLTALRAPNTPAPPTGQPKTAPPGVSLEASPSVGPPSTGTGATNDPRVGNRQELSFLIRTFGDLPPSGFVPYYPRAEYPPTLIPEMTALIVCFLPFVVAASTLVREAQEHTLEVLLTVSGLGPLEIFLGKALNAVAIMTFVFLGLLIEVQWLYGIGVKSHLETALILLLPAMLSATCVGLAISVLSRSHTQAIIASGGYLVAMGIFSGFLYPVALESGSLSMWISRLFPLTFATPILKSWMSGAGLPGDTGLGLMWLVLQCAVYGLLGIKSCYRLVRRI